VISPSFRLTARLFAAVLLLLTAADLLYCHVWLDHQDPIRTSTQVVFCDPSADPAPLVGESDHSFCCSHRVNVGNAFEIAPQRPVSWVVAPDPALAPPLTASSLYRPPLG